VADSTVVYDREEKIPLYTETNIIEVWLVDINEEIVEVYQQPTVAKHKLMQKRSMSAHLYLK